jgi:hypothetical protein
MKVGPGIDKKTVEGPIFLPGPFHSLYGPEKNNNFNRNFCTDL